MSFLVFIGIFLLAFSSKAGFTPSLIIAGLSYFALNDNNPTQEPPKPIVIVTPQPQQPAPSTPCTGLDCQIIAAANKKGIDPALIFALMKQESNHKSGQRSSVGARGYMQVMPFNASFCGITKDDLWETEKNLDCGVKILTRALVFWDKKIPNQQDKAILHALGEYNSGRGAVANKNSIIKYPETRSYVIRILSYWKLFKDLKITSYPRFHPHSSILIIGEKIADNHYVSEVQFPTRTSLKIKTEANIRSYLANYDYINVTTHGEHTTISLSKRDADNHLKSLSNQFFKTKGVL